MRTVVLVAALTLAACSGTEAAPPEKPEKSAAVTTEATCGELFDGKPRLWSQAVAAVAAGEVPMDLAIRLTQVADASGSELQPHLQRMAETVKAGTHDAAEFKSAARSVADICTPYVT